MKKEMQAKENMKKKRKRRKAKRIFCLIIFIILAVVIGYAIWFAVNINKHKEAMGEAEYDPLSATALGIDPEKLKEVGRLNVLVVGESDANQGLDEAPYYLADTIMVVSYNPQTQQASILSIPRDTYVGSNITYANASYKINCIYRNKTRMEDLVEAVEDLTGLDLEYYVTVDTAAIRQIVDAIGGVRFNVPIDMDYDDDSQDLYIHIKAGEQLLDGQKAEHVLRFRHNNDYSSYSSEYGDNDFGRMRTQREFIQETAKQLIKIENAPKAVSLLDIVFKNVETNLDMQTLKYYIPYVFKFDPENIQSDYVPGESILSNEVWIYAADKEATAEVVETLFTDKVVEEQPAETNNTNTIAEETTVTEKQEPEQKTETKSEPEEKTQPQTQTAEKQEKTYTIELLNGTGSQDKLTKVKKALEEAGFDVTKSGETSSTAVTMIINRTKSERKISDNIKQKLGTGTITSGEDNSNVDFTIILGNDYK